MLLFSPAVFFPGSVDPKNSKSRLKLLVKAASRARTLQKYLSRVQHDARAVGCRVMLARAEDYLDVLDQVLGQLCWVMAGFLARSCAQFARRIIYGVK